MRFFELASERDLEGVVGKFAGGIYQSDGAATSWVKFKNPSYTQAEGRGELFESGRGRFEGRPPPYDFAAARDCVNSAHVRTGIVCMICKQPYPKVENQTEDVVWFHCPLCDYRGQRTHPAGKPVDDAPPA